MVISFPESWSGKLGGTDLLFSVRPKCYKKETESLHCNLGGTGSLTSVRPKRYEGKQRDYNPISVRPRSLSVRPICLGFVAVAMTFGIGGAG